jgi:hypothetical protein
MKRSYRVDHGDSMRRRNILSPILELATGTGLILFWLVFFLLDLSPQNAPDCYHVYEHAFPVPDFILAATLLAAGILVLRGKRLGISLSIAAGGALVFLGLLDLSFNIQNGFFLPSLSDFLFNASINLWSITLGTILIIHYGRTG